MKTFLELVQMQGFSSINEYLDAIQDTPVQNDISASRLEKIRQSEAMTEELLGGAAC